VAFLLLWYLVSGGIFRVWHAGWRWSAMAIAAVLASGLYLEYRQTAARRAKGLPPAAWALAAASPLGRVQAWTAATWEAHERRPRRAPEAAAGADEDDDLPAPEKAADTAPPPPPVVRRSRRRKAPWVVALLLTGLSVGGWILMTDRAVRTTEFAYTASTVFQQWRLLEGWADVAPGRRAAPGPALDADGHAPMVRITRTHRSGSDVRVTLACWSHTTVCRGQLRVRSADGRERQLRVARVAPQRIVAEVFDLQHRAAHARVSVVTAA
jgi:hypothetical protein